jgi:aubergine-like protein
MYCLGDAGKEIALYSNYFRLTTPTNAVVQTYHIDFEPNIEAIYLRRKMIYSITELFDKPFIFDGMSNIKTTSVQREDRSVVVQNPADQSDVHIKIRHTGEIPWGSHEMMRMYNTQMRKNLRHIGYVLMGRNYFDRRSKKTIPEFNIELWPGIVSAINQHDGGILMVIDSSTKFVRAETVLQLLSKIRQQAGDNWLEAAKKELCGSIVMTSYNSKTYRVDDLNPNINPTTTFRKNDKEISLIDYYKQSYDVVIRQHTQPLLECLPNARDRRAGRTEKIWLVPELCSMTGLTDKMRSDFNLMRKIGDVSRLPPDQRVNALTEFISKVSSNPDVKKEMDDWGLAFERQLVEVQARQLMCEKIFTGNDDEYSAQTFNQRMGDFSKEIRSKQLHAMCTINRWVLVADPKNHGLVEEFCQTLKRVCTPMGINLFQPKRELLQDDRINTYVQVCQRYGPPCEMIVLLVPNNNKDRYDAIKKICYCENPMPSQVVVHRTIVKKQMLMSVCTKIAIQMACKMGGEPWALKIPVSFDN